MNSKRSILRLLFKLGMLCVLVGASYRSVGKYVYNTAIYIQQYKVSRLERGESFKTIIFGDSVALGMHWTGHPDLYNYSMAYLSGIYPYRYLLQQYLRFNQPPKVLVLTALPMTFSEPELFGLRSRAPLLLPWSTLFREVWKRRDWMSLSTIVQMRFHVNESLVLRMSGKVFEQLLDHDTGALLPVIEPHYVFSPSKRIFSMSDTSKQQLNGLIKDAEFHGIRVMLYFMPVPRHLYESDRVYYQQFEESISQLAKNYPSVLFCRPYPPEYLWPDELFMDSIHLNSKGIQRWENECFPSFYRIVQSLEAASKVPMTGTLVDPVLK